MDFIQSRRSIRKYTDQPVEDSIVKELLKAAMSAPSASGKFPWHFIVIRDRDTLNKIADIHMYGQLLRHTPLAILICGSLAAQGHIGYIVQDCSAATENILLEAHLLGLGAVWLGVYPREERINPIKKLVELPDGYVPVAMVSVGHPAESKEPSNRYSEDRVHYDRW